MADSNVLSERLSYAILIAAGVIFAWAWNLTFIDASQRVVKSRGGDKYKGNVFHAIITSIFAVSIIALVYTSYGRFRSF